MRRWLIVWVTVATAVFGGSDTMLLRGVQDNRTLDFEDGAGAGTVCEPYGVWTLEELADDTAMSGECHQAITAFYQSNPELQHYAQRLLEPMQRYRVERREGQCILYARGQRSYAELLLHEGLAIKKTGFTDTQWRYRYEKAQRGARFEKRGIWDYPVWKECAHKME